MTDQELQEIITKALFDVAPDIEGEIIDRDETFADQFEIDSMDFLNFVVGLHKATGINIPEADHPKLSNMADCIAYLKSAVSR